MAEFSIAYPYVKKWEGGYSNVVGDYGGETYAGITRKNFPGELDIWEYIDFQKRVYGPIPHGKIFSQIDYLVEDFYNRLWDKHYLSHIKSQKLANLIFDFIVNSASAIKTIQQIVGVTPDGIIRPVTLNAINAKNPDTLFKQILDIRKAKYIEQAKTPSQQKFLAGWLNRLEDFYSQIGTVNLSIILILFIILILIR